MQALKANPGKELQIVVKGETWARLPIKTRIIKDTDEIAPTVESYTKQHLRDGDLIFISEKIIAIMQGRAFPITKIKPSFWAKALSKFVLKTPYGIGLGSPWTMQLAIEEAGLFKILLGSIAAIITKPFGIRGVFYKVAGKRVNAIDGPCEYTLPPYNKYAKLPPKDPDKVASLLKEKLGFEVIIIDANDLGVDVLGKSSDCISIDFAKSVFRDNPLGQSDEQTPICIVRKISENEK
jgi:F420-0:gamma-glutamyl ligase-like protein